MMYGESGKVYLGDSVYAYVDTMDFNTITLTTENGFGPSNTIYLDRDVIAALKKLIEECKL